MNKIIVLLWLKSVSNSRYSYLYYVLFRLFAYMEQINNKIYNIIMMEKSEMPNKDIQCQKVEIPTEKDKTSPEASMESTQLSEQDVKDYNQWRGKQ